MGITYQTNNRQRRKVMTAPLTAPAPSAELPQAAPVTTRRGISKLWLSISGAATVAALATLAARAF